MNREQKAAVVAEIAEHIKESDAIFAVDYRGISVAQVADLRGRLREADATFRVVKNTLTERAAGEARADTLKPFLAGPTALTFVRGDAALAAKAIQTFNRETDLLPFKGGLMDGDVLSAEQVGAIARLPSRDVLYGQLVGIVAHPIAGLARTLNALLAGVAIALGQVQEKKERGELPAGDAPAPAAAEAEAPAAAEAEAPAAGEAGGDEPPAQETPDQDAEAPEAAPSTEEPAEGADDATTATNDDQADASA